MMSKYAGFDPSPFNAHQKLIRLVGENKTVLDVGCAAGHLGRVLQDEHGCRVWGIERDTQAAEVAAQNLHQVLVADLDTLDYETLEFPIDHFDVLLFADVLEHLRDPWGTLRGLRPYLRDEGCVLISLPNVAHLGPRLKLLFGHFDYRHKGILDEGHLRFFTLRGGRRLLQQGGYRITQVDTTFSLPSLGLDRRYWYARSTDRLGSLWPGLLAYQFIFRAVNDHSGEPGQ